MSTRPTFLQDVVLYCAYQRVFVWLRLDSSLLSASVSVVLLQREGIKSALKDYFLNNTQGARVHSHTARAHTHTHPKHRHAVSTRVDSGLLPASWLSP